MNRTVIGVVVGVVVVAVVAVMNRPEPTPQERLEDAVQSAGDSLQEAGEAISDGVRQAGEDLQSQAEDAANELAEQAEEVATSLADRISTQATAFSAEALALAKAWEDSGILTSEGFDLDKAKEAVAASSLEQATKDRIVAVLEQIQATPELFDQKMQELHDILKTAE
ncbi:MAG: hypothetical protein GJ676_10220 [Rhodobacteraceae bacterium]|nr:hypothetical protein [Paracoccaceae bacterium]